METVVLPHLASSPLQIGLFTSVTNASFLRQQLLDGNQDFEYAFLDTATIISRQQVLAACFRAINDDQQNRLKTRNVHSEIVFALSPTNNIAESFRRFGISPSTTSLIAIKVSSDADAISAHLTEHIQGECVPLTDEALNGLTDWSRIAKVYKVEPLRSVSVKTTKTSATKATSATNADKADAARGTTDNVQTEHVAGDTIASSSEGANQSLPNSKATVSDKVDSALLKWRREAEMYILGSMAIKGS